MKPKKNWKVCNRELTEQEKIVVSQAEQKFGLCETVARLLVFRGYDSIDKMDKFLHFTETILYDPFLMKDMKEAAERVLLAVRESENIAIYGDYDVDGVSATAMMFLYLEDLNERIHPKDEGIRLGYYIPKRIS